MTKYSGKTAVVIELFKVPLYVEFYYDNGELDYIDTICVEDSDVNLENILSASVLDKIEDEISAMKWRSI